MHRKAAAVVRDRKSAAAEEGLAPGGPDDGFMDVYDSDGFMDVCEEDGAAGASAYDDGDDAAVCCLPDSGSHLICRVTVLRRHTGALAG